jgi:hypothetical protein
MYERPSLLLVFAMYSIFPCFQESKEISQLSDLYALEDE